MDFLVAQTGPGVNYNLKNAVDQLGPSIWIRPFSNTPTDVETTLNSTLSGNSTEPVRLVVDLDGADLVALGNAVFLMLTNRVVAGHALPEGSSIILTTSTDLSFPGQRQLLPAVFNKLFVVDLTRTPGNKTILEEAKGITDDQEKTLSFMVDTIKKSYGPDFKPKIHAIVNPEALGVGLNFAGKGKSQAMEEMTKGLKVHKVGRDRNAEDDIGKGM